MTFYQRSQPSFQQQQQPTHSSTAGSAMSNGGGSTGGGFDFGTANSPLGPNAVLNGQYNNLNLSNSSSAGGFFGGNASSNNNNRPTGSDGVVSPTLNFNSLYSSRARFNASKGFDVEDDLEFCPEIQESYLYQLRHGNNNNNNFTHHRFNPYTTTTYTPQSPTLSNSSPVSKGATPSSRQQQTSPGEKNASPRVVTPRVKKVLEIVNPATGLRVSSPAPYK